MRPVRIKKDVLNQMIQHAQQEAPLECCGLLLGEHGLISNLHRMNNHLRSAVRFEIAPRDLFEFFRGLRTIGQSHLGIYHSHPASDAYPSATDVQEAFYSDCSFFIVSLKTPVSPQVRAFHIENNIVNELEISEIE